MIEKYGTNIKGGIDVDNSNLKVQIRFLQKSSGDFSFMAHFNLKDKAKESTK